MAIKTRDFDAELLALTEKARKLKAQKTSQLGELVQLTGADSLSIEAIAGILLAALDQAKDKPEAVARWTERGQAFFQQGGKRGKKAAAGEPAAATTPGNNGAAAVPVRAA
jgi:hypothetical protein